MYDNTMNTLNIEDYIPNLSIDCVIFGYENKQLKVLVSELTYGNTLWALPGGYIKHTEDIDTAASRILQERTSLTNIYLEQFKVFGNENRIIKSKTKKEITAGLQQQYADVFDQKTIEWITGRFVCLGYYALVDITKVQPKCGEFEAKLVWQTIDELPDMTHDHNHIVDEALNALQLQLDQKLIAFNLLPPTFIMKEVKELYEAIYNKTFPMNNFQKKILDLNVLERLGKKFTGAQNRAPFEYRFKKR